MSPSKLSRRQRGQEKIKKRREGWKKRQTRFNYSLFCSHGFWFCDSNNNKKDVMKYYFAFEQCCSLVSDDNKQSRENMLRSGQKAWNNTERVFFFHGARQSHTLFCLRNGMTAISLGLILSLHDSVTNMNVIFSQNNSVTLRTRGRRRAVTSLKRSNLYIKGKISSKCEFMRKTCRTEAF